MAKKQTPPPVIASEADEDEPIDIKTPAPKAKPTPVVNGKTEGAPLPKPTVVKASSNSATKKPIPVWVWYAGTGVVVLVVAALVGWKLFGSSSTTNTNTTVTPTNTSNEPLVARTIDGVLVPTSKANTNIYAIMIENQIDSRPPSNLDKASVVYETLAEGGITRFMALYPIGGENMKEIGPVRSARPYYISWAEEYKALYVHAGGSPQALSYLQSNKANVVDFNQFSHGGNFIRDDSRAAPHNLYTSSDLLYLGIRRTSLRDAVPTFSSWSFKGETPIDTRPQTVNDIVVDFSSFNYKVTYKYDRVQNRYMRYQAEKPHVTRTGEQIYAKDVVVMFAKTGLLPNEKQRLDITTVGSGKLLLFRDGTVTEGTWKKDSNVARTQFLDASGSALALNPGQIWIETVPTDRKVTY